MSDYNLYPIEPFICKSIKPISLPDSQERKRLLEKAGYNVFQIPADGVFIDLLTDSGTGALSENQWAALMSGDESYASATSWQKLEKAAKKFSGMRYILPVHQGRAAEKIISELFLSVDNVAVSNGFFDTTQANFEHRGAICINLPTPKALSLSHPAPFKGDMNTDKLEASLFYNHGLSKLIKLILMTLTNNAGGGQPASLKNIKEVARLAKQHKVLFVIDACRIAENAYFIKRDELKKRVSVAAIVRNVFACADLVYMSTKKDGLANSGGLIFTNQKDIAEKLKELVILYEGYTTYGGMSGREMETVAQGLDEVINENYLRYRIGQVAYLHQKLKKIGLPLINPPGGHAVYINASALLAHIPTDELPSQSLISALYLEGGIRAAGIDSLMFGGNGVRLDFVRLALPRRVYTQSHLDYVAEICRKIMAKKKKLKGLKVISAPQKLPHFSCRLQPIPTTAKGGR